MFREFDTYVYRHKHTYIYPVYIPVALNWGVLCSSEDTDFAMSKILFSCHNWKGDATPSRGLSLIKAIYLTPYKVASTAKNHLSQNVNNAAVENPDVHHLTPRKMMVGVIAIKEVETLRFRKAW